MIDAQKDIRQIFRDEENEHFFRRNGYVVFDLLDGPAIDELTKFHSQEFSSRREVFDFAKKLPYYITIFDLDDQHKKAVDKLISSAVLKVTDELMIDYEVFYSNFMIKYPNDGQIEAHQDFNFVDESVHTAFNLWSPLVDTTESNGGLFVIPGSHKIFRSQRGPNFPHSLTRYNQLMKRYASHVPLRRGQAILFDHKLIHYSPPNYTSETRIAIQSVLKPKEADACQYMLDEKNEKVKAYYIDKNYIFENNLWDQKTNRLNLHHEEDLIPFPSDEEVLENLVQLKAQSLLDVEQQEVEPIFLDPMIQEEFSKNGFVKLGLLEQAEVSCLRELFHSHTGGVVQNTDYGMYISMEDGEPDSKKDLIENIRSILGPKLENHLLRCRQHLGSFLVKAPGENSFTYPHQDWTFVHSPKHCSATIWIALVDTNGTNGNLGFVKGSHRFFKGLVGSPSPQFKTYTQGHEDIWYQFLQWVPLKAGEAVAFDNRTIHGAPPNRSSENRLAVGIGITPQDAELSHYYLVPGDEEATVRKIARLTVDDRFFREHSLSRLQQLFRNNDLPSGYEPASIIHDEYNPFTREEVLGLCKHLDFRNNGMELKRPEQPKTSRSKKLIQFGYERLNKVISLIKSLA